MYIVIDSSGQGYLHILGTEILYPIENVSEATPIIKMSYPQFKKFRESLALKVAEIETL